MGQVRAYLQLVRLPAVFTAMADILLGFLATHSSLSPASEFVPLLAASTALYLAGMAFNDLFDRAIDAHERPNRPIPSGRVSAGRAAALASSLMVAGLICAFRAGPAAAKIALLLAGMILAYDRYLKITPLGPVAMGGCRLLNVMLGASGASPLWAQPQLTLALALGIYVAGITWLSRQEAGRSSPAHLSGAAAVIQAGLIAFGAFCCVTSGAGQRWVALGALALIALIVDWRLAVAIREPRANNVQGAVKRLLLAICLLDATMVYFCTGDAALGLATAALVIPAATLGRWIFIT